MRLLLEKISERTRLPVLSLLYGVAGGLATVAFMLAINRLFAFTWTRLAAMDTAGFLVGSFLVLAGSSLAAGLLMTVVYPAAGSGVPELKAAYWTHLGEVPFRAVLMKFAGGVISLAGGASLGREGPSVFVAGGLASNVARWLGIDRRKRRHAAATGAAAGLAAAFNTPLAAVSFVLEEILGDLGSRLTGSVVLAAVAGAFIVFGLVGRQPSFSMPSVDAHSWSLYAMVPVVAALAAAIGLLFQRAALGLRGRMRALKRWPAWLRPLGGALVVWAVGGVVYLATRRLGVFGLGYEDLSQALVNGIDWRIAGVLVAAKLVATVASYGTGSCGGIFSPTLFMGAMCGFACSGIASIWIPLAAEDHLVLAATGMCACFGAVVRAPVTSILMIFEMTHQFGMVPALMLGTLVSQAVARVAGRTNFYEDILLQDGHEIHKIAPPRNLAEWRALPVAAIANRRPVAVTDLAPERLRLVLDRHPYRCFPVILDGVPRGVVTRDEAIRAFADGRPPQLDQPVVCRSDQSLQDIEGLLIQSNTGLFLVRDADDGPVTGVFTLHDLLRAQAAVQE